MGDLFNEKTTKRMVENSDLKISKNQKDSAKKWIELLETGELKAERSNNMSFMKTILNDVLSYSFDEVNYEKNNVEFSFDKEGKRRVLIETKGTETNLKKPQKREKGEHSTPIKQLFDYMSLDATKYGILTNYRYFMLFDYETGRENHYEFDFLDIKGNPEKLKEFILIFSRETLIEEKKVEKIRVESEVEERRLTNNFYKLFHETRLMLLKEFMENGQNKEESLYYAQLFMNRLMFVFFAEDINLIPRRIFETTLIKTIENFSENSSNFSNEIAVLFEDLDKGSSSKEIQQFNGGLFKEKLSRDAYFRDSRDKEFFKGIHSEKNNLEKDLSLSPEESKIFNKAKKEGVNPLIENMFLMASYDFKSDLKVNILGHIFEQSLSDLEEIKEGSASKRKKDGIFYTPEYITDYICRNTIIPYLSRSGTNDVDKLIDEYSKDLEVLEDKFSKIKILDPACGSGAFLIKAVDILFEISGKIQNLKEIYGEYEANKWNPKNKAGQLTFKKFEEKDKIREIIEKNIYGVDLNGESIETTKLSLFLRIAKRGKKLPDLSDHIKCGNSLIDDKEIAGDKAFNWKEEFNEVFDNGGFDVVIGNPPYVEARSIEQKFVDFLRKNYESSGNRINTFASFIEKGINLLKEKGEFSYIIHRNLIRSNDYEKTRKFILKNTEIKQILSFTQGVFEGVTGEMTIIILRKNLNEKRDNSLFVYEYGKEINSKIKPREIKQKIFEETAGNRFNIYLTSKKINILEKLKKDSEILGKLAETYQGIIVGNEKKYVSKEKISEKYKPILRGRDISRYGNLKPKEYVYYIPGTKVLTRGKTPELFEKKEKILTQHVSGDIIATLDAQQNYFLQTINSTNSINKDIDNKFLLVLMNSKLINFYYSNIFNLGAEFTTAVAIENLDQLPIKQISPEEQKPFTEKTDLMLRLNKEFYEKKDKFYNRIKKSFSLEKINRKLENFYLLEFNEFIKEIEKQSKKKIPLKEQDEWEDYFNDYKRELSKLKEEIGKTDREIDRMVYGLYGLTDEEIRVVEED